MTGDAARGGNAFRTRVAGLAAAILASLAAAPPAVAAEEPAFSGVACMAADGTVELRFRAPLPSGGGFGEGMLHYRPGDPHYREVIDHVGGLKPGECKPVAPWPDPPQSPPPR